MCNVTIIIQFYYIENCSITYYRLKTFIITEKEDLHSTT